MKQLYTLVATCAVFAAAALALHPTFLADGGYLQHVSVVILGFAGGVFSMLAAK